MTDIIRALRYSTLPYPKGCSLSGSLEASFVPTIVIKDEPASAILFTASSTIAIEFEAIPIIAYIAASTTLATIPTTLVFII